MPESCLARLRTALVSNPLINRQPRMRVPKRCSTLCGYSPMMVLKLPVLTCHLQNCVGIAFGLQQGLLATRTEGHVLYSVIGRYFQSTQHIEHRRTKPSGWHSRAQRSWLPCLPTTPPPGWALAGGASGACCIPRGADFAQQSAGLYLY